MKKVVALMMLAISLFMSSAYAADKNTTKEEKQMHEEFTTVFARGAKNEAYAKYFV